MKVVPTVTSKNVSWYHFSWTTLYMSKYVGPDYYWAEMHARCVSCCPLVSHIEYAPRALLRLE